MKHIQRLVIYLAVLAISGAVTVKSIEPGAIDTKATVRSYKGTAKYSLDGITWEDMKVDVKLPPMAWVKTGPESEVYMSVNGVSSAVKVKADTTLQIPKMEKIGGAHDADTETQLDLKGGSILGQVKKVNANSHYEVKTPHGVAGIRGTDFNITVAPQPGGTFLVTFTSVTGTVIVSAVVDAQGNIQTVTLHDGQSWTPGQGGPVPTGVALLQQYQLEIQILIQITIITQTPITAPAVKINPVFPGGPAPGQGQPSG